MELNHSAKTVATALHLKSTYMSNKAFPGSFIDLAQIPYNLNFPPIKGKFLRVNTHL